MLLLAALDLPNVAAFDFPEIVSAAAVDPFAADVPAEVNVVTSLTAIAGVLVIADVPTLFMFLLFLWVSTLAGVPALVSVMLLLASLLLLVFLLM